VDFGTVTYEIHLHPTYRVPCLWFNFRGLPPYETAFDIETVFRRLVPDQFKQGLRGLGGIGGISADVSLNLLERQVLSQKTLNMTHMTKTTYAASPHYRSAVVLRPPLPRWRFHVGL
jgi:hypothetical protein